MRVTIPDWGLILMIGASGAGKTTFVRKHFRATEVLSSDHYRGVVADDDRSRQTSTDAFEVMREIARRRLGRKLHAVIDATNLVPEDRRRFIDLARGCHAPLTAIIADPGERACLEQNGQRADPRPRHVIQRHCRAVRRSVKSLRRESVRRWYRLASPEELREATLERQPLACNRRALPGPFDIIGDVHGCFDELLELLQKLDYRVDRQDEAGGDRRFTLDHPDGRRPVFLGDLVDRGPESVQTLGLVMDAVEHGGALAAPGNHDAKLARALSGHDVQRTHGLDRTMDELEKQPEAFRERVKAFVKRLPSHYELDRGRLVVAHAGMKEELQGRISREVRDFALYGETTGETDEFGLPVRLNWARDYRGRPCVVYGHTPVTTPEWVNNTICIDTGCAFGGRLTALRYPERETVSVEARRTYREPATPPAEAAGDARTAQQQSDELLDMKDMTGALSSHTRLMGTVRVGRKNTAAALETMIRFAIDPRWLIYLPPTMAPCDASPGPGLLERPKEAFDYFRTRSVRHVVCEDKHMGSRAVAVLAADPDAALRRFGVTNDAAGVVYTRTGRRFFDDPAFEALVIDHVRRGVADAGLWAELETDWICLDCELMPWSAKGGGLVARHYAPVAAAAATGLDAAVDALAAACRRNPDNRELLDRYRRRREMAAAYDAAYRRYNWPVDSVEDLEIAPFHILASEGAVHVDRPHTWHMEIAARLARDHPVLAATEHRTVDLDDARQVDDVTRWWETHTERGAEGMVVKPLEFIARTAGSPVSPAIKCRGEEYLRIIYGPEYTEPRNIDRLRWRATGFKQRLALREFALGIDALEKFTQGAPLREVHRRVFSILALETEPIDPRL